MAGTSSWGELTRSAGVAATALDQVQNRISTGFFTALISIESPYSRDRAPRLAATLPQVVLSMLDTDDPDEPYAPRYDQVGTALLMGREHASWEPGGGLLVHCHLGRSRSVAVAIALVADRMERGEEAAAVEAIIAQRGECAPNRLILEYADDWLERRGRLVDAVEQHPVVQRCAPGMLAERSRWLAGWREDFLSGG